MLMEHKAAVAFLLLVAILFATPAQAQCLFSFDAPRSTGLPPVIPVAVADFDGDGKPDAVFRDAIYFAFRERTALRSTEVALRAEDLNGDGLPDLLVAVNGQLAALLSNGDRTFTRRFNAGPVPSGNAIFGDFDGDGFVDVFAAPKQVYLGKGDGTFAPEASGIVFLPAPMWAAADVDGDGRDDLIAISFGPGQAVVYRREANGFAPGQLGPPVVGTPLAIADFDGDGRDDIVFSTDAVGQTSALYFNIGGPSARQNFAVAPGVYRAADVNGDGAPDLVVATLSGVGEVAARVLVNDGKGGFTAVEELHGPMTAPAIADADGDGNLDLIAPRGVDLFVIPGNGDGTFRAPRVPLAKAASGASGDFDGDGDDDIALPTVIGWNNGDNTFRLMPFAGGTRIFTAADVDRDGKAEIILEPDGTGVDVIAVRPDGAYQPKRARINVKAIDVAAGYVRGFPYPYLDLAVVSAGSVEILSVYDMFGGMHGDQLPIGQVTGGGVRSVAMADLNGDGRDDVIVAGGTILPPLCCHDFTNRSVDGFISTFISTGTSFEPERRTPRYAVGFERAVTGDFDGDRKLDVAVALHPTRRGVVVWYGDGTGNFSRKQELLRFTYSPSALRAADFNGDGISDLAVGGAERVFLGSRNGLFEHGTYFGSFTLAAFAVRARPGALPWIVAPAYSTSGAFVYRPVCGRGREKAARP
jgi:FG-GAP-like repeat